jgi:hypothetical protein
MRKETKRTSFLAKKGTLSFTEASVPSFTSDRSLIHKRPFAYSQATVCLFTSERLLIRQRAFSAAGAGLQPVSFTGNGTDYKSAPAK